MTIGHHWKPAAREACARAIEDGRSAFARGALDEAFAQFERAHVLGQRDTLAHVRAHRWMLRVARARRDGREVRGQLLRIVGAATKTWAWVPAGNTGGANVSAFRRMPVAKDIEELLR